MISYSNEIILSKYMQHYNKKKFTEIVCFGLGCGLQFEYDSVSGVTSPFSRNIIERFFQKLAYHVKIVYIKRNYSYPVKQIREYIDNGCLPIIQFNGQYGLVIAIDVENNFLIQNYDDNQQRLPICEILQKDSECKVYLVDNCFNEDFPSNHDLKMIYCSSIYIDISEYCFSTSTSRGLQGIALFYENNDIDIKCSVSSSFQLARNKYADWLDRVSDELSNRAFSDASNKCRMIAELWCEFQDTNNQGIADKALLKDIYNNEAELCKDLGSIIGLEIRGAKI